MGRLQFYMRKVVDRIARVFSGAVLISGILVATITAFLVGYVRGYGNGWNALVSLMSEKVSSTTIPFASTGPTKSSKPAVTPRPSWGGPQLWDAVNKRRVGLGVNPLSVREELCTIASIRLNQILELGKLDGHAGFSSMPTDRPDLKWIFDKYNLSEFLVSGATSAQNAVDLWENTLGHKELLSGGQYVWGCIYAQNGFGVAIAAY